MTSLTDIWSSTLETARPRYARVLELSPFDRWDRNRMPESTAESELINAVRCALGGAWDLADVFLARLDAVLLRIEAEATCETARCRSGFPVNHATVVRARQLYRLLIGLPVDSVQAQNAARLFRRAVRHDPEGLSDEVSTGWWVEYLRALALASDTGTLRKATLFPNPLPYHEPQREALAILATGGFTRQSLGPWLLEVLSPSSTMWGVHVARLEWLQFSRGYLAPECRSLREAIPTILGAV